MKKLKAILLSLFVFVVGAFCLVACGESNYEGVYKFAAMTISEEGAATTIKAGETYEDMTLTEDYIVIELKSGGKAVVSSMGESISGTWAKGETEGQIVITIGGDPQTFACDGTTMTKNENGREITLKKSADASNASNGASEVKIEGTYKFESMTVSDSASSEENTTITLTVGQVYNGRVLTPNSIMIQIEEDGSAVMIDFIGWMFSGGTRSGSWQKFGESMILVKTEGLHEIFHYDGTTLRVINGVGEVVLRKDAEE